MTEPAWWTRSFEALSRRKVFRAGAAYVVVSWILVQVADTILPAFAAPESSMRILIIALVAGFPVILILSWLYDFTRDGVRRTRSVQQNSRRARAVDLAIIGLLALAVGYLLFDRARAPTTATLPVAAVESDAASAKRVPSVAVLPFENLSTDPNNEIFADGLAEDLLIRLASIESLRVPGRTSSFRYKGVREDIGEIARALNVGAILEGTVQAYEATIKVTARLMNVEDGFEIWSKSYTDNLTDVFAIQEKIARDVARNLEIELVGADSSVVDRPTQNMDAYRLYLRGRNQWHKRTSSSLQQAISLFQAAIDLDPTFANAWSGLADAYGFSANYGNMPQADAIRLANEAARKALALDPNLPEAHASLGLVLIDQARMDEAIESLQRAIDLNPGFADARMWLGGALMWEDPQAGLVQRRHAAQLEPLSPIAVHLYGSTLQELGHLDEARRQFLNVVDFAPDYPLIYFDLAKLAQHDNDYVGAIRYMQKANELDPGRAAALSLIAHFYMELGDLTTAAEWLHQAQEIGPDQMQVISTRLGLMQMTRDFDGMLQVIETQLSDDSDFFVNYVFRSIIAYEREQYEDAASWMRKVFERFNGSDGSANEIALPPLKEESMFGVVYLASALQRSGDTAGARALTEPLLDWLDGIAQSGLTKDEHLYARVGALLVTGDERAALDTVRQMAERGYPGYLRIENDGLFAPIRNELEFRVSMDFMRRNARQYLDAIRQI